jgi:8-oxo-dGTP diphosphatase
MKQGINYIGVAVGAMIFNEAGELFLSKRSQRVKNERGCWEVPGGSVDFGERLKDAIIREMLEEYGAEITVSEQFPAADHMIPNEKQHWVATTFVARFKQGQIPRIMEPEKCDEIGWFSLDNLPAPLSIITQIDINRFKQNFLTLQQKVVQSANNNL